MPDILSLTTARNRFSHPKACPILRSILLKIEFYEDFRYLRQNMFNVTQYVVMALLEHLRHLQAGDSGTALPLTSLTSIRISCIYSALLLNHDKLAGTLP